MAASVYNFGPFRLEAHERRLLRSGSLVPLSGKAFDTLLLLVEGAGTLQHQQALMDRLWPDTFVEPNNLQHNVSLVRRVLDGASGVELQTVRGQGYRLVTEVSCAEGPDYLGAATSATQQTYFCKAADGARLAFAKLGAGPPIVKAANWLSHLELDERLEELARALQSTPPLGALRRARQRPVGLEPASARIRELRFGSRHSFRRRRY